MTTLLLLLTFIVVSVFAGYQIKTRRVGRTNRSSDHYEKLFWEVVRVVIRETIRAARVVDGMFEVKPETEEERLQREQRQHQASPRLRDQERKRERNRKYWADHRMRNLPQNTPQWYKNLDNGVWEFSKIMLIGLAVMFGLLFLFIISINMG